MRQLAQLQETFHKFYVCTAVRKFFFFLDPLRTGRIAIPDILCSGYLDKLLEVNIIDIIELLIIFTFCFFSYVKKMLI